MNPINQLAGIRRFALLPVLTFLTFYLHAQDQLFLNLQSTSPDFPNLTREDVQSSNQFMLQISRPFGKESSFHKLSLIIRGNGIELKSQGDPGSRIYMEGNKPLHLLSYDLGPYFDIDNMSFKGISAEQYATQGLPEGLYTVCFSETPVSVGRTQATPIQSCVQLWMRKHDPPVIIQPSIQQQFTGKDQIIFQWAPRHISIAPVQYHIQIFEAADGVTDAELVTHFRPVVDETTFGHQFLYAPPAGILHEGKTYVAFVLAESLFQNIRFKNGGFSDPVRFELKNTNHTVNKPRSPSIPDPACEYPVSDAIINEFNIGIQGGRRVFIEILVTGIESNTTTVDLEGWIIDDNNLLQSNPNGQPGHIKLGSGFGAIPRGTLITIYESSYPPSGIVTSADGLPGNTGKYQVPLGTTNSNWLTISQNCPSVNDSHYSCTPQAPTTPAWTDNATFEQSGDVVSLRKPNGEIEHTLVWNTSQYEIQDYSKVLDFGNHTMSNEKGFALTAANDWYTTSNYSVIASGNATAGVENNTANGQLISELQSLTNYNPFYITCTHRIMGNSSWAVVDLHGTSPSSWFKVYVDNNPTPVIFYSINDPIFVQLEGVGYHIIKVVDQSNNCSDEAEVEVPSVCVPGTDCDDLNSCTDDDILDAACNCAGTPDDDVVFLATPVGGYSCDYCVSLDPEVIDGGTGLLEELILESILIELPTGETILLNQYDNLDDDRNPIFNFPYCGICPGNSGLILFMNDLNAWIQNHPGISGVASIGATPLCEYPALIFTNTNLTLLNVGYDSNLGEDELEFEEYDCNLLPSNYGYNISATLENCGAQIPENANEVVDWLWSNGSQESYIFSDNQADCYSVTITCSSGCTYVATFPEGVNCDCIVGSPCIIDEESPLCSQGIINEDCYCILIPVPDADGDGVCDLEDICPGFDDEEDTDTDGTPDGCDICHDPLHTPLTHADSLALQDNNPENDPAFCGDYPCNAETSITIEMIETEPACDYCLPAGITDFPNDPLQFLDALSYTYQNQTYELDVLTDWSEFSKSGFEENWGDWIANNSAAEIFEDNYLEGISFANSGWNSVRLSYHQQAPGYITSSVFNEGSTCQVELTFSYIAAEFNNNAHGLQIQYSNNNTDYTTVAQYLYGADFNNDIREHVKLYLIGPFTSTTTFRIKSVITGGDASLYIDDIALKHIVSANGTCFPTHNGRVAFKNEIDNWFNDLEIPDVTFEYTTSSGVCNGLAFRALNTGVKFNNIKVTGAGHINYYAFDSHDCGSNLPGEKEYVLTAASDCNEESFAWSTGQNSSSITIPSTLGGYQVTITCEDDCEYVETYGNQSCLVGAPCNLDNPCSSDGHYNANCECIPDEVYSDDDNENGIPDCKELVCECDPAPFIEYVDATISVCSTCVSFEGINGYINRATVTLTDNTPYQLATLTDYFEFPYCLGNGDGSGCNDITERTLFDFRSDLYQWMVSLDFNPSIEILNGQNHDCGSGLFFYLEDSPIAALQCTLNTTPVTYTTATNLGCISIVNGYSVGVNLNGCPECSPPAQLTYEWSDGSTDPHPTATIVPHQNIGYIVTVTCTSTCKYIIRTENAQCIVGEECEDGYSEDCTNETEWNEHCECVDLTPNSTQDTDGDGINDECDLCDGFDDHNDDDGDTVPNGCDKCPGYNDFEEDLGPPLPSFCQPCDITTHNLYTSQITLSQNWCPFRYIGGITFYPPEIPLHNAPFSPDSILLDFETELSFFRLGYCYCKNDCPVPFMATQLLAEDLEQWLKTVLNDYNVNVYFVNETLIIENSFYWFKNLYFEQELAGGDPIYKPFSRTQSGQAILGNPCDDGNPCTIWDRWTEACDCLGVYQDTDGDGICDGDDPCDNVSEFIMSGGGILPDCVENNASGCGEGNSTDVCDYFVEMLAVSGLVNYDPVNGNYTSPTVFQKNLKTVQDDFINELTNEMNLKPYNFPYPELLVQLLSPTLVANDSDQDGIVNYLDPCPGLAQPSGYFSQSDFNNPACGCTTKTWESMVIIYGLLFEVVNNINTIGTECYGGGGSIVEPGCAVALGIDVYEDEDCILRAVEGGCAIEFYIDCDGNCRERYLGYSYEEPNEVPNCDVTIEIGTPCNLVVSECPDDPETDCEEYSIVPNPEYPASGGPCICEIRINDADGDGICDGSDPCPEIDFADSDGDGIDDCIDDCPGSWGMKGDSCSDNNPCTWADVIDENCNCTGVGEIDLDDDGVFDCQPCEAAKDYNHDGYIDEVDYNHPIYGYYICDICPGMDDTVDEDGDGRPDCIFPPYKPIGCPVGFHYMNKLGFVLVYNSDEILEEDLPEPISIWSIGTYTPTGERLLKFPYLLISSIRESNGTFEVLYEVDSEKLEIVDPNETTVVGISYSGYQQCIMEFSNGVFTPTTATYVDMPCPQISFNPAGTILTLDFLVDPPFKIDPNTIRDKLVIDLSSPGGNIAGEFPFANNNLVFLEEDFRLNYSGFSGLGNVEDYTGSITLPNQIVCEYSNSGGPSPNCGTYNAAITGSPCDDGDPCTHHDTWLVDPQTNECICKGDEAQNADGDMLCDAIDPCPTEINPIDNPDNDGDGYPDCPCDGFAILGHELVNGNDVEIEIDMTHAEDFSHVDVVVSGGPEEIRLNGLTYSNPLIVENLPFGYYYSIRLTAICLTNGQQTASVEVDIPFAQDQFICGLEVKSLDMGGYSMLPSLQRGDIIKAADFDIIVGSVSGSSGKFTGLGYIKVPYLGQVRINVSFADIIVNVDYQMVKGKIEVNGFGLALLGDDLSNAINDLVNKMLDPLMDLEQLLTEMEEMLKLIDEYVATTSQFVSDETKNCMVAAQQNLDALKVKVPPATEDEIKAAAAQVQYCLGLYEEEMEAIMGIISEVLPPLLSTVYTNKCNQSTYGENNFDYYKDLYYGNPSADPPIVGVEGVFAAENLLFKTNYINTYPLINESIQNDGFVEVVHQTKNETPFPGQISQEDLDEQLDFYQKESNYHFCYLLRLIADEDLSDEYIDSPEEIQVLIKLLLEIGNGIIEEIRLMQKKGFTNEEIVNSPEMQNLLESYLRSSVQLRSYGNIRQ